MLRQLLLLVIALVSGLAYLLVSQGKVRRYHFDPTARVQNTHI